MTDHEVRIYASPSPALAQVVEICIYAMDDAGARWRLTWKGIFSDYREPPAAPEGSWGALRAWATQRLRVEGLAHLRPVRHRDDDAEAHVWSTLAIDMLQGDAHPKALRALARYTGPSAGKELPW